MLMGNYCKAYPVERLRAFPGWTEKDWKSSKPSDPAKSETAPPDDPGHFYLQENYIVTADIFLDQYVVFDQVSDEWRAFCHDILKFENPMEKESETKQKVASTAG